MPDHGHELAFATFLGASSVRGREKRGSTTMSKECPSSQRQLVTS